MRTVSVKRGSWSSMCGRTLQSAGIASLVQQKI
jgi:hypothetical protein